MTVIFLEPDWTDQFTFACISISLSIGTIHIFLLHFAKVHDVPLTKVIFYKACGVYGIAVARVAMLLAAQNRSNFELEFLYDYCFLWKMLEIFIIGVSNSFDFLAGMTYNTLIEAFSSNKRIDLEHPPGWQNFYFLLSLCFVFTVATMVYADTFLVNSTYCLAIGGDDRRNNLFAIMLALLICIPSIFLLFVMVKIFVDHYFSSHYEDIKRTHRRRIAAKFRNIRDALFYGIISYWLTNIVDIFWVIYFPLSPQTDFENRFYLVAAQAATFQNVSDFLINYYYLIHPQIHGRKLSGLLDYPFWFFSICFGLILGFALLLDYVYDDPEITAKLLQMSGAILCLILMLFFWRQQLYYPKKQKIRVFNTNIFCSINSILITTGILLSFGFTTFYYLQIGLYIHSYRSPERVLKEKTLYVQDLPPQNMVGYLLGISQTQPVDIWLNEEKINFWNDGGAAKFNFTVNFDTPSSTLHLNIDMDPIPTEHIVLRVNADNGELMDEIQQVYYGFRQEVGIMLNQVYIEPDGEIIQVFRDFSWITHVEEGIRQNPNMFTFNIEAAHGSETFNATEISEERDFGIVSFLTAVVAWSSGTLAFFRLIFPNYLPRHFFRFAPNFDRYLDDLIVVRMTDQSNDMDDMVHNSTIRHRWNSKTMQSNTNQDFLSRYWSIPPKNDKKEKQLTSGNSIELTEADLPSVFEDQTPIPFQAETPRSPNSFVFMQTPDPAPRKEDMLSFSSPDKRESTHF